MHLVESYSNILGAGIGKPYIYTQYYPVPYENYITVQTGGGMPAKEYKYFQYVIDFVARELEKQNIGIVHLGSANDRPLEGVFDLRGKTTINQSAHIISQTKLHFGVDSSLIHIANIFDRHILGIYSVSPPEICGAYKPSNWFTPIEHDKDYSFNPNENPRNVDLISPEKIIEEFNKVGSLGSNFKVPHITYLGDQCADKIIEVVPDFQFNFPDKEQLINIRLDWLQEKYPTIDGQLAHQVMLNHRYCLVLAAPVPISFLLASKSNCNMIMFKVKAGEDPKDKQKFLTELRRNSIPFQVVTEDVERLNDVKLHFFDHQIVIPVDNKENYDIIADSRKGFYRSKRVIYGKNGAFLSKAGWIEGKNVTSQEQLVQDISDLAEWSKEAKYYLCYN